MPIDNLSIDSEGDVFAARFPDVFALLESLEHSGIETKTGIENAGYEVTKVREDIERRILPGSTTVVLPGVKTNSFWFTPETRGYRMLGQPCRKSFWKALHLFSFSLFWYSTTAKTQSPMPDALKLSTKPDLSLQRICSSFFPETDFFISLCRCCRCQP